MLCIFACIFFWLFYLNMLLETEHLAFNFSWEAFLHGWNEFAIIIFIFIVIFLFVFVFLFLVFDNLAKWCVYSLFWIETHVENDKFAFAFISFDLIWKEKSDANYICIIIIEYNVNAFMFNLCLSAWKIKQLDKRQTTNNKQIELNSLWIIGLEQNSMKTNTEKKESFVDSKKPIK